MLSSAFESGSRVIMQKKKKKYKDFLHRFFTEKKSVETFIQQLYFNRTLIHVAVMSKVPIKIVIFNLQASSTPIRFNKSFVVYPRVFNFTLI